jgi:hypothetical protein
LLCERPDPEEHGFWFDIQPVTGTTLSASVRVQVNVNIRYQNGRWGWAQKKFIKRQMSSLVVSLRRGLPLKHHLCTVPNS